VEVSETVAVLIAEAREVPTRTVSWHVELGDGHWTDWQNGGCDAKTLYEKRSDGEFHYVEPLVARTSGRVT
jgi:hypothetical protein